MATKIVQSKKEAIEKISKWEIFKKNSFKMLLKLFSLKFVFSGYLGFLMYKAVELKSDYWLIIGLGVMIIFLLAFREASKIASWVIQYKNGYPPKDEDMQP